jgi:ribosomal protein RSM22 (predicted rRNA methylase)
MRKMPYTYQVFKRILHEVKTRLPHLTENEKKISVLDYGAGLGSGMWAAIHCFGQDTVLRTAGVEPNVNMRKLGKFMTTDLNENNNILWLDSLAMIPGTGGEKGKFDIVIVGYVLQEITSARGRQLVIDALWQRVKDGGVLIIVEPGSPKGFRYINDFRNWIIAKDRSEACIVAPCPHHGNCPMAKNPDLWCNFSQLT